MSAFNETRQDTAVLGADTGWSWQEGWDFGRHARRLEPHGIARAEVLAHLRARAEREQLPRKPFAVDYQELPVLREAVRAAAAAGLLGIGQSTAAIIPPPDWRIAETVAAWTA